MHGPGGLPVPLSTFVGREAAIDQLTALIGEARLVSVTGMGGSGKSRLALAVAQRVASGFPDGVWWVPLAQVTDPAEVAGALARAVQLTDTGGRPPIAALLARLRTGRMLLICDNCEHIGEAVAEVLDELLAGCAGLHVLATSQRRLGVAGEITWILPPLSTPAGPVAGGDVYGYEAVRLFVDRARSALPQFDLTDDNADGITAVCRRLEGIPLAIELAAARIKVLSVQQIATRLDDALALLIGGVRTAVPRHRTLRATLDRSFELLGHAERQLLAELSVFAGSFDLDAVESMHQPQAGSQPLDVLTELVDWSLVTVIPAGQRVQYRLPEPVRQYATQQLATREGTGGVAGTQARHDRYVADLSSPLAAMPWCRNVGSTERAPLPCSEIWWSCYLRGYYREGRAWLEDTLGDANGVPESLRAKGLLAAEMLTRLERDYDQAAQRLRDGTPRVMHILSGAERERGDYAVAQMTPATRIGLDHDRGGRGCSGACRMFDQFDDREGRIWLLISLGTAALARGEHPMATTLLTESLALSRAAGYREGAGWSLHQLGRLALREGEPSRADRLLRESLAESRTMTATRAALPPERFAELWSSGQAAARSGTIESTRPPVTVSSALVELRIQALGAVRVHRGSTLIESSAWTYAKPRELLYFLLSQTDSTKEQIGAALWPATPPAKLRNSFHTTLHHLRRALGDPDWITYRQGRYAFNRNGPYDYDVAVLEAGLARVHSTESDAQPYLAAAVEAYQGDFLTDLPGAPWIDVRRAEFRTTFERVLLALGRSYANAGQFAQAVQTYLRAITHDNLLEAAHRELIRCYARMGERARALHHYNNLVTLLRDQLGVQPSTETRDLYTALRNGTAPALPSPRISPSA